MKRMWKFIGGAAVLALCLATTAVEGQRGAGPRGAGPRGGGGPFMGQSIDVALENQEALELSQEQVRELQGLKSVMDGDVSPLVEELKALREGLRNGEVDRTERFRQMQALQGELLTASAPLQGRVQEILTVDQHRRLQPLVRRDRLGQREGAAAGPGLGFRGRAGSQGIRGRVGGGRTGLGIGSRFNGRGRAPMMAPRGVFLRDGVAPTIRRQWIRRGGIRGPGGDTLQDQGGLT